MPAKNNLFVLFGIILVLAVSGCVGGGGGGTTSAGGSVAITGFAADETAVEGNQKVTLTLEVKNQGDSQATSVRAQLLNLDLRCPVAGPNCEATDSQWGLISGQSDTTISQLMKVTASGEEVIGKQYTWRVQAPKLPANMKQTYDATSRVSYAYSTDTTRLIRVVSKEEYDRLKQAGQLPPVHTTVSSNGPIGIEVAAKEPITIEDTKETFNLVITLKNLASGTVYADNIASKDDRNKLWVMLVLPPGIRTSGVGEVECQRLVSAPKGYLAELIKGSFTLQCEFETDSPVASIDKEVRLKAQYGYFSDSTVKIAVTGKTKY